MKEPLPVCGFSHPTKKGAIDRRPVKGSNTRDASSNRPFILSLKGSRSKASEAGGRQSSRRVGIATQQKVCQMGANPNLTCACLPAATTPTLGFHRLPPYFQLVLLPLLKGASEPLQSPQCSCNAGDRGHDSPLAQHLLFSVI